MRLSEHRRASSWFWDINRVEVVHYPDRATAERAEARAIRTENPLHNKAIPPARKIRPNPRPLIVPYQGPPTPRLLGYACGRPDAMPALLCGLQAEGVPPELTFTDEIEDLDSPRPNFYKLLKYAQHEGTRIITTWRGDFCAETRRLLAQRGVELQSCQ
jgi:hypothetical protein